MPGDDEDVCITVCGRGGIGRSTVIAALAAERTTFHEPPPVNALPDRWDAPRDLDGVIYLLGEALYESDRHALDAITTANPAAPAVCLLSKADAVSGAGGRARELTDALAAEVPSLSMSVPVLPVCGALAMTLVGGEQIRDEELPLFAKVAEDPSPQGFLSPDVFVSAGDPDQQEWRTQVVNRWGIFGVRCVALTLDRHPSAGAPDLTAMLWRASGIEPLRTAVADIVSHHLASTYDQAIDAAGYWREQANGAVDREVARAAIERHSRFAAAAAQLRGVAS